MRKQLALFSMTALLATGLWGCGSLDDGSTPTTGPSQASLESAATVGADSCVLCHASATPEKASEWLGGAHANNDSATEGPNLTYAADPDPTNNCIPCHNPLADGAALAGNVTGQVDRPVVGCESCHGGGELHLGSRAIAYPRSSRDRCVICHYLPTEPTASFFQGKSSTTVTVTWPGHGLAAADNLTLDFTTGQVDIDPTAATVLVPADGAYSVGTVIDQDTFTITAAAITKDALGALKVKLANHGTFDQAGTATVTLTQTQHGLVAGQQLYLTFSAGPASGVYRVATVPDADTFTVTAPAAATVAGTVTIEDAHQTTYAPVGAVSYLGDSHFDDTASNSSSPSGQRYIEGYVVKPGATGCNDCHNAHSTDLTIQRDWAQSAHAGRILTRKLAGLPGATNSTAVPFPNTAWFSNWDQTYQYSDTTVPADGIFDTVTASRAACQRCHTATGVANFLTNPAAYDPNKNDFSHLSGWQFTWQDAAKTIPGATRPSDQNELLYCWGCHTDAASGALRTPGAINMSYTNGATATYPDVAGSNVCIACHSGRETGDSIKLDPSDGSNRSFISSHYFTGGGTVFKETGYEYAGQDYEDYTDTTASHFPYRHSYLGSTAEPGTGSNGPCVACHMSRPETHLFMPVVKDAATDAILSVEAPLCGNCHFGADLAAVMNDAKAGYEEAQQVLADTLAAKGIHYYDGSYYTAAYVSGGTNVRYTNWASLYGAVLWKDTMGAAFNLTLLAHDGGGYAHNRIYAKRLLFDAIDFIDNGVLDGTITINEATYADAAVWFVADAATNIATRP